MSNLFHTLSPAKLFVKCALPNVISMAFMSLYYVIDGIFVGKYLGSNALAALGLIIPFVMMSFALADMIALGSAVQISMKLGIKKFKQARQIFSACVLIIFLLSCCIGVLEYFLAPFLIDFLNVSEEVKNLSKECMLVFAIFAPITMLSFALDNYLRICGKTTYSMMINIIIALSNIFLDYLFIVVFGWGLFSAALATCIGLSLGGILGILPFLIQDLDLKFTHFFIPLKLLKNIIYNGSSEFFNNISASLFSIFANLILLELGGTNAVAAFSIILYIDSFIVALIIAMSDAMQPALSYNYARKDFKRIKALLKITFVNAFIFSLISLAILLSFKENLVGLFAKTGDDEFIQFSAYALMIFTFNYFFAWFNILSASFLTAFNKPKLSLILSLSVNLFAPLCFLLILSLFFGLNGIWISSFAAELCMLFLAVFFLKKCFGDKI
ncbi:MATE family efflux transporter [Campylobacter sp. US33a]|uniref:MATE family efflux transporter n=1 Tax=Campylobacter sp. US33a TaxID=2498120 RepID=UPI00106847C1|nr:MATE family efflux transporter [Campylobacter sp. US33a]TEY04469.1 MATE family efflux transporter [Campylobacter sp. US33a]